VTTAPAATGVTYIHTDGLGSPVARTDASRQVISRTRYEAYGYVAAGAPPTIGFTGHVNDADTGLTYMQQRYYDSVAGKFLSIDLVTTDTNTGSSFNRYNYAANNPYRYVDPDDRAIETVWDAGNVAMGAVSLAKNIAIGNYVGAVIVVVGIGLDAAATATPFVPGGAATIIKASRGVGDAVQARGTTDFIVTSGGVATHASASKVRDSLEGAGMAGTAVKMQVVQSRALFITFPR